MQTKPIYAWRGQYRAGKFKLDTQLGSLTFCDSMAVACHYAKNPNNSKDSQLALAPVLIFASLRIDNPIFNDVDRFWEFEDLIEKMGAETALKYAVKHSEWVEATEPWRELKPKVHSTFKKFIQVNQARLPEFYIQAYVLFDDPEFIADAISAGFDGAIHPGSGVGLDSIEYRLFSESQVDIIKVEKL